MVDNIADLTKESWEKVFDKPIIEFLNLNCYLIDKRENERKQLNDFKKGELRQY